MRQTEIPRHLAAPKAKLMARVGEEFPFACPGCGGDIRLIAFITDPGPIRKILTHLVIKQPLFCKCRDERAGHLAFMFR